MERCRVFGSFVRYLYLVPVDIFLIASSLWIIAYQIDKEEIESYSRK